MKRFWIFKGLRVLALIAIGVTVFGYVVMTLWNWLLPSLTGWHVISFWQALGLLILSKILFGGFRGGGHRPWQWRRRMMERWERMTPEEREKFRDSMRGRCGSFGARVEPKA